MNLTFAASAHILMIIIYGCPVLTGQAIIFSSCGFFFFFFFSHLFSAVAAWMSTTLPHMMWPWCEFRMQVWNVLHAVRWK